MDINTIVDLAWDGISLGLTLDADGEPLIATGPTVVETDLLIGVRSSVHTFRLNGADPEDIPALLLNLKEEMEDGYTYVVLGSIRIVYNNYTLHFFCRVQLDGEPPLDVYFEHLLK